MLKMNGHEFEFDLFELETARKYEKAIGDVMEKLENAKEKEMLSESIEMQCDAIKECIDKIFGDGTGVEVCGQSNLNKHLDAFEALVDEAVRQRKQHDDRALKYLSEEE